MNTKFYMAGSPAGAGKTFATVKMSGELAAKGHKILIAQNTKNLMKQTRDDLLRHPDKPRVKLIYAKSSRKSVMPEIEEFMRSLVPDEGQVLIISHVALKRLNGAFRKFWDLIVDEIPSGFEHMPTKIAKSHAIITDHLDVTYEIKPGIAVVRPGNAAAIQTMIDNETDDQVLATFNKLLRAITDPDRIVLVDSEKYEDLITNPSTQGHVDFYAVLNDTFVKGFKSVTMMGANAHETSLFVMWEKLMDVTWEEHPVITKSLLYTTHTNGSRLTISYLFDRPWSGRFADTDLDDGTVMESVVAFAEAYFDGRSYLWHANEDHDSSLMRSTLKLPAMAHGLDRAEYRRVHNVVLLSALNYYPQVYKFLAKLRIDNDTAQAMISYQTEYQAMMRCSLRDDKAVAPVTVMVMSRGSAEWLQSKFPGSKIEKLETGISEPRKVGAPEKEKKLSDADNAYNWRQREKVRKAAAKGEVYVPIFRVAK
uniref:Uncharacterized protein n=1 Tax=Caulobacter sp. (strain K31) TaxID=366602 RepID=B0T652_CAUSK